MTGQAGRAISERMTWKATGKLLDVDENQPLDAGEPTQEDINRAQRNWHTWTRS
jgi:hypothetical protein